jgi:hypothetical protein
MGMGGGLDASDASKPVLAEAASEPIDESSRILTEAVSNEPQQHLLRTSSVTQGFWL